MTSREEELVAKLKGYLDQGAADLRPGLAYRLQQARAQAIARLDPHRETESSGRLVGAHGLVGAGAGGADVPTGQPSRHAIAHWRVWVGIAVLALAAYGWQQWTAWQDEIEELEDLDAQILTSDLPVDALADRGFGLFLEVAPPPMPAPVDPDELPAGTPSADAPSNGSKDAGPAPAAPDAPRSLAPVPRMRVA